MSFHGSPKEPRPVISIRVEGDVSLSLTMPISESDRKASSKEVAVTTRSVTQALPVWHRTSVIWSATAAVAAVCGPLVSWLAAK